MDAWFWLHLYIVFRGLVAIFLETVAEMAGTSPEKICLVQMRLPTLTGLFKYVNRLRAYDVHRRKQASLPRLIVEGTYFPPEAHVPPFFRVEGKTLPSDKRAMADVVRKYPGLHLATTSRSPVVTWMRVVALKVHCAYHHVVMDVHRICSRKGAFLVLTITNDPFAKPCATTIGLHDKATKDEMELVLGKIPNLKRVSF